MWWRVLRHVSTPSTHAVGHDHGVAVALFVILFDNPVKVIVIVGIYKFFLTENFENICFLIGF